MRALPPERLGVNRRCTKCGGAGPFHKDASHADGLTTWCQECVKTSTAAYRKANPGKRRKVCMAWFATHPEKVRSTRRRQYVKNQAKELARANAYNAAHRKEVNTKKRANQAHNRLRLRAWEKAHPANVRAAKQRRRAALANVENTLTQSEWLEILEYFNHSCAYCLRDDVPLELDHVIALSRGGGHTKENVVPACKSDNCRKKDRPVFLMAEVAYAA